MSWLLDDKPLKRILVTRLRYLGDIAMSTVLLEVLRRGDSELQLDYLCEMAYAPLLAGHPLLARVHALETRRTGADAAARAPFQGEPALINLYPSSRDASEGETQVHPACRALAMARRLRHAHYDLAVDLLFNPRSAWLLYISGVRRRIGGLARGYRKHLYTHLAPSPSWDAGQGVDGVAAGGMAEHLSRLAPLRHADGRSFQTWLVSEQPVAELAPMVCRPQPKERVREVFSGLSLNIGRYVLLAPGATWSSKEWPVEHWHALIEGLLDGGCDIAILCPPRGAGAYGALRSVIPAGRGGLLPPLPLAQALEVVGSAALLVSVDGGIMHAAVAMKIPTVALFGPTDPSIWFPYRGLGPYRVLATQPFCHPCPKHECSDFICMPGLSAKHVQPVVFEMLAHDACS